jgi:hypothetical protein
MATVTDRAPQVFEHEGILWRAKPGASSSFDEYIYERGHWLELFWELDWNPWRKDELAPLEARCEQVLDEWERAEPDFRPLTARQVGARRAAITRKVRTARVADEARWERDKERYDPEREMARFALLERQAMHGHTTRELAEYQSGERYPGMAPERRAKEVADLRAKLGGGAEAIAKLTEHVGDPEDVVDEDGKLPRDRRTWNVIWYRIERKRRVEELMESTEKLRDELKATKDRKEKGTLQGRLGSEERRLSALLAVPRLEAEAMCADCYTPQYQHVSGGDVYESRPCPRWPLHAARMERVREILRSASERIDGGSKTVLAPPPQPLASLPGTLPIAEVIERLSELQAQYPDAVVKRGRANRWELWPATS